MNQIQKKVSVLNQITKKNSFNQNPETVIIAVCFHPNLKTRH